MTVRRRIQGRGLERDADARPEGVGRADHVDPEHGHRSTIRDAQALEDLDGRRLAGAVRAEQAEHLALMDIEADPVDGDHLAVRFRRPSTRMTASPSTACAAFMARMVPCDVGPPGRARPSDRGSGPRPLRLRRQVSQPLEIESDRQVGSFAGREVSGAGAPRST